MTTVPLVRTIGRWSLVALVLNSIIGSGVFALPGTTAARLGPLAPVAWIAAALVIAAIMACFAEVASRFTGAGGPYLYAQAAFGRFIGLQMGWMAYLVRITAAATNINVFTAYLAEFWAPAGDRAGAAAVAALLLGLLAAVNLRGVSGGARLSSVFAVAKVVPLILFLALGIGYAFRHGGFATPAVANPTPGGWLQAILLLIFAYGGFEAALMPLAEARDPRRDAPFALLIGLVVCATLYTLVQIATLGTLADPGGTQRPLAEAARVLVGGAGAGFMALGAMISVYGYCAMAMVSVPRLTYAMAEQGDLPRLFAWVHPRFRTPAVSIVVFAVLAWGLAVQGSLLQNLSLSAVSRLSTYGLVCAALPVLRWRERKGGAPPPPPPPPALLRLPAGPVLAVIGVLSSLVLATRMSGREALLLAVVVVLALVHWLAVRRS